MKKFKLLFPLLGLIVIMTSFFSCSKDDEKEGNCLTCSYMYDGESQLYSTCEDDDEWKDYAVIYDTSVNTWAEFEEMMKELDKTYDYITCE